MKILFISNLYPPNVIGGYERLCYEVAEALEVRGHEISVLTSDYGGRDEPIRGQNVIRSLKLFATEGAIYVPFDCTHEQREIWEENNTKSLLSTINTIQPDIVFVWNLYFFNRRLLDDIQSLSIPKVYLLTDNWMIAFYNSSFINRYFANFVHTEHTVMARLKRLKQRLLQFKSRNSTTIDGAAIFASHFMRDLYRSAGFNFKMGDSICYHGVHFPKPRQLPRQSRSIFSQNNKIQLLFAGRIVDIKGVHTAITALPHIQRSCPEHEITLTIVGDCQDQSYKARLDSLIERCQVQSSVIFRPPVNEIDLFKLFQQHDIYLFPSLYEPFSLTLILALESGIPTVASAVGGNVEIVENEITGLTFKANDPIDLKSQVVKLIQNDELRVKLSVSAIDRASTFTFEKMISNLEIELERLSCA